jgi:NhaA family Na+:H+ antiporter
MLDPALKSARRPASVIRDLLASEAAGGIVLMVAAAVALILANSPLANGYFGVRDSYVAGMSVLHWINDALMAVFFLLVGLEIKREFLDGQLATWRRRILPGIAAAGGMIVPAIFYLAINISSPETLRGWAIPTATDIAFALGVLALLGSCAPVSLKIFLTALAIIDDLGAVLIIAVFYTADLSLAWLGAAALTFAALLGLNRAGIERSVPYLVLGAVLWYVTLKSGVHATIAGVALAVTIPLRPSPGRPDDATSPLHLWEHALRPWVAFMIVPIFGLANAGVQFSGMEWAVALAPVTLGIAVGLFVGKQLGVFFTTLAAIKLKFADQPANASLAQIYGVSLLCGVGFTMSLFIGMLGFQASPELENQVKVGVLLGSTLSAVAGAVVLLLAHPGSQKASSPNRPSF